MGAKIRGAGTNVIKITGVPKLIGHNYTIIPDRIEAGTYMVAVAMTGGDIYIENAISEHLKPVIAKLNEAGVKIEEDIDGIRVSCNKRPKAIDIKLYHIQDFLQICKLNLWQCSLLLMVQVLLQRLYLKIVLCM